MKSELRITAGYRQGKSYLKDAYYTVPYRVANVGQYESDQSLYLMTMSSSPGILDTDEYHIDIQVEANARLQMQSQSYQRLYQMKEGSSQIMNVILEPHAVFSYVPHPIVPHQNSKFHNKNKVEMADECELIFSEIITCGRKLSGEVFLFSHFQNLTEVYHKNRLIFKDNVWLEPEKSPLNSMIQLEHFTHQAALVYISTQEAVQSVKEWVAHFHELLSTEENIIFGVSELSHQSFVIRVLAHGGEQIYTIFKQVEKELWQAKSEENAKIQHLMTQN